MMTATTKTFNMAGGHVGNVIIENPELQKLFRKRITALGLSPNAFGLHMATAAYSKDGAIWLDALIKYLDKNRRLFDAGINAIPGLKSMQLEATYLAWVDFSATGMTKEEFTRRVQSQAKIAANHDQIWFFNPTDVLCSGGWCSAQSSEGLIYSDEYHLSKLGSAVIAEPVFEEIERIISMRSDRR